jgi:hypothetical protein
MTRNFAILLLCSTLVIPIPYALAQKQVDVSQCFSPILQQVNTLSSLTRLDFAYVLQMNEEKWKTDRKNGTVAIGGIVWVAVLDAILQSGRAPKFRLSVGYVSIRDMSARSASVRNRRRYSLELPLYAKIAESHIEGLVDLARLDDRKGSATWIERLVSPLVGD